MESNKAIAEAKNKFENLVEHFKGELVKLRTGRANATMLDGLVVEAYGTQMPLNQVATVSVPEAQLIQISPFDPNNLQAISTAIRDNQSLGLNPADDGHVIRIPVPPLTEERRKEIVKQVGVKQEEAMIGLRSIRHSVLDIINKAKKDKQISEDEAKRFEKQIDDSMASHRSEIETIAKTKEQEIITI